MILMDVSKIVVCPDSQKTYQLFTSTLKPMEFHIVEKAEPEISNECIETSEQQYHDAT